MKNCPHGVSEDRECMRCIRQGEGKERPFFPPDERALSEIVADGKRWEQGCIRWRAWAETLAMRLGIEKPERLEAQKLQRAIERTATRVSGSRRQP